MATIEDRKQHLLQQLRPTEGTTVPKMNCGAICAHCCLSIGLREPLGSNGQGPQHHCGPFPPPPPLLVLCYLFLDNVVVHLPPRETTGWQG